MVEKQYDLTIITPVFNEEGSLRLFYSKLKEVITSHSWEVIFIDDCSEDDSLNIIKDLKNNNGNVSYISFSKNYGHQIALSAGYDKANGKAVISLDSDLQHPIEQIPKMVEAWERGSKVVLCKRVSGDHLPLFKKYTAKMYYSILGYIADINVEEGVADFRLLDKSVVKYLRQYREKSRYLRGIVSTLGFKHEIVEYIERDRVSGESEYTLVKMLKLGADGVLSFSSFPLRISMIFGVLISVFSFIYAAWIVMHYFIYNTASGLPSIMVGIFFLGGVQLISVGILGEYIGKIYVEVKNRPLYIVEDEE